MIAAEIEPADLIGHRRSPRAAVALDADMIRGGLDRMLCRVTDLSRHGVRLQTWSALKRGALVWLSLPGLAPRTVRVMRADDFSAGCEFTDPLHRAEFASLVARDASLDRHP